MKHWMLLGGLFFGTPLLAQTDSIGMIDNVVMQCEPGTTIELFGNLIVRNSIFIGCRLSPLGRGSRFEYNIMLNGYDGWPEPEIERIPIDTPITWTWEDTAYHHQATCDSTGCEDAFTSWTTWQWEDDSTLGNVSPMPMDTTISVIPASDSTHWRFETARRAYVVIINWAAADSITVPGDSLATVLMFGQDYDLRHAHHLDMSLAAGQWKGQDIRLPTPTEFNVFVIREWWPDLRRYRR